jgi:hypothetical protein
MKRTRPLTRKGPRPAPIIRTVPLPVVPDYLLRDLAAIDSAAHLLARATGSLSRAAKGKPSARAVADLLTAARTVVAAWHQVDGPATMAPLAAVMAGLERALAEVESRYLERRAA